MAKEEKTKVAKPKKEVQDAAPIETID